MGHPAFVNIADRLVCLFRYPRNSMNYRTILYWALVVFSLYLTIEVIRKMLGGSLGFEELMVGLQIANLGYTFQLHLKLSEHSARLSEHLGWHQGKDHKLKN